MPKQKSYLPIIIISATTHVYKKNCWDREFIFSCVIIMLRKIHPYRVTLSHIIWFADIYRDYSGN